MIKIMPESKYKEMEQELYKLRSNLSEILWDVVELLNSNKFDYNNNEAGSGEVTYSKGDIVVEFNQFPYLFTGFYVNKKITKFIELITIIKGE